jgi:hypothetical protein
MAVGALLKTGPGSVFGEAAKTEPGTVFGELELGEALAGRAPLANS